MIPFRLPDLGEGLREAEIVSWQVEPGSEVSAGQVLAIIETDKAQVEVTSPRAGRIARLGGAPGDLVAVGAVLVEFEGSEEAAPGAPASGARPDAGTVVGELPRAPVAAGVRAAPAVRARARELGVDLAALQGSGPGGAVTMADVAAAGEAPPAEGAAPEPLRGVRLAMARNMARAGAEVVPATVTDDADVEDWSDDGAAIVPRLVRAIACAAREAPALNAHFDARGRRRILQSQLHLALAVETDDGLIAPVLRDAGAREPRALRAEVDRLAGAARDRSLPPEALRGATFTLSNFGAFGGRYASLVVVPPQVAILGAGRAAPRVCARNGRPEVRRLLPLSLSFDHRAVTGAEATRFLTAVRNDLERPT